MPRQRTSSATNTGKQATEPSTKASAKAPLLPHTPGSVTNGSGSQSLPPPYSPQANGSAGNTASTTSYATFGPGVAPTIPNGSTEHHHHVVHHYVVVQQPTPHHQIDSDDENYDSNGAGSGRPRVRAAYLAKRSPLSDCTCASLCPIIFFGLVCLSLFVTMLVYPRLLSVHVHSVGLDFSKIPPIKFVLTPSPAITLHLVGNVSIWNPLFTDLHNVSVFVAAKYPHFDPPVTIGYTTLDHLLDLPSHEEASERIPFDLQLPGKQDPPAGIVLPSGLMSAPLAAVNQAPHALSSRIVARAVDEPSRGAPGLLDVVLALIDDCNTRGFITLDLEVRTRATTKWWHFGGSKTTLRGETVQCKSDQQPSGNKTIVMAM
ncbi:hypothetical protein BCR44DRAFT_36108, partial [Catenaria anguillulae PL171]